MGIAAIFWITELPVGSIITIAIYILFISGTQFKRRKTKSAYKEQYDFFQYQEKFTNHLLLLIAAVIESDQDLKPGQFDFVRKNLTKFYPKDRTEELMAYLDKVIAKGKVDHKSLCKKISWEFTYRERIEVLHLLISIAVLDGLMMESEKKILRQIAFFLGIPAKTFQQILKLFYFKNESHFKQKEKKKSYSSSLWLSEAYELLGLSEKATIKQIKKAYRKLALLHHPDRVIHMDEAFQTAAKEKFQKIADAYEYIKDKRGFS